jgi:hypothetical protein
VTHEASGVGNFPTFVQKIDSMLRTGAIVCYDDEQRAIW